MVFILNLVLIILAISIIVQTLSVAHSIYEAVVEFKANRRYKIEQKIKLQVNRRYILASKTKWKEN